MSKKDKKEPMFRDFNDFKNWASGYILTSLLEEGGKGLRSSVHGIINAYVEWDKEVKEQKKNEKTN